MYCPNCAGLVRPTDSFCRHCATRVKSLDASDDVLYIGTAPSVSVSTRTTAAPSSVYLLYRLSPTKFMPKKQQQPSRTTQIAKTSFQRCLLVLILKAKLSNNEQQSYSLSKKEWHLLRYLELWNRWSSCLIKYRINSKHWGNASMDALLLVMRPKPPLYQLYLPKWSCR
jgi:hypothetical protein